MTPDPVEISRMVLDFDELSAEKAFEEGGAIVSGTVYHERQSFWSY